MYKYYIIFILHFIVSPYVFAQNKLIRTELVSNQYIKYNGKKTLCLTFKGNDGTVYKDLLWPESKKSKVKIILDKDDRVIFPVDKGVDRFQGVSLYECHGVKYLEINAEYSDKGEKYFYTLDGLEFLHTTSGYLNYDNERGFYSFDGVNSYSKEYHDIWVIDGQLCIGYEQKLDIERKKAQEEAKRKEEARKREEARKAAEEAKKVQEKLEAINKTLARYLVKPGFEVTYKIFGTSNTATTDGLVHDEGKIKVRNNVGGAQVHITISQTKLVLYKELRLEIDKILNDRVLLSGSTYNGEKVEAALTKQGDFALIFVYSLNGKVYGIYFEEQPCSVDEDRNVFD